MNFDRTWTLFLDRDGVINRKLDNDYVKSWSEFEFLPGALPALKELGNIFGLIFIVTNQQGIGKGLYTEADLTAIHRKMMEEIRRARGRIDKIYFCPELAANNPPCRKPNTGMPLQAQKEFPLVNFSKSVIVGDSMSDMEMGRRLGMRTILIADGAMQSPLVDMYFTGLHSFAMSYAGK
jgi:D-glycero-D-manno-heptose 1,7-bisphosphate phosphatase